MNMGSVYKVVSKKLQITHFGAIYTADKFQEEENDPSIVYSLGHYATCLLVMTHLNQNKYLMQIIIRCTVLICEWRD